MGYAVCHFTALQPPENRTADERFETGSNVKICFIRDLLINSIIHRFIRVYSFCMSDKKKMNVLASSASGVSSLIITVILLGLGERIGERFLPVYLVATGASLFVPSVLNALDNFLSAVYSFPGWIAVIAGSVFHFIHL